MILCETLDDRCDFPIEAKCCCLSEEIVLESVTTIDVTVVTAEGEDDDEEDEEDVDVDETAAILLVTDGSLPVAVAVDVAIDDELAILDETVAIGEEKVDE